MGEVTLKVPAEKVEALRGAVVSEVGFWNDAVKQDLTEIREVRERRDDREVALADSDLNSHQRALGDSGVLVAQLPAAGTKAGAEIHAGNSVLVDITGEAARMCLKSLAAETEYAPFPVEAVRTKMEELDWWLSRYESYEATRVAEVEANKTGAA